MQLEKYLIIYSKIKRSISCVVSSFYKDIYKYYNVIRFLSLSKSKLAKDFLKEI